MKPFIVNFGLNDDYNWYLMKFIHPDTLSRLPLNSIQIDKLACILNWDILSSKSLDGWIFVKYKNKIDWRAFLQNEQPKNIIHLLSVNDKLYENSDLFHLPRIKKLYYTPEFVSALPNFIDWKWYAKHKQIDDYLLLRYWNRMPLHTICKYQKLSLNVLRKKKNNVKWQLISKSPLSNKTIEEFQLYVYWDIISQYQNMDPHIIEKFMINCNSSIISRYQTLPEWFIEKYIKWVDIKNISQYQELSIDFIKKHVDKLHFDYLAKNKHYNKVGDIQIFKNCGKWHILDAPLVTYENELNVVFYQPETENLDNLIPLD